MQPKLMSEEQLAAYRRIANNWADCNGDEARLRDCLGRCVAHIDALTAENAELRTALGGMNGSFQKAKAERDTARAALERTQ